jgi:methylglutaconyl-CoA hydratase
MNRGLSSGPVPALQADRDGDILRITLARPERRNAFDAELIAALHEAFADVGDARVVVLAGEGPSFCAGADVEWQRSSIDLSYDENVEDAARLYRMLAAIDSCPAPVVARIQGYALGGGSGLAACADITIAAKDATFGFSEVKLGIVPTVISPFVLAKIGAVARRFFLTGERFDAPTALRIGLVAEVAGELDAAVERVVGELLTSGPGAVRAAKQLVREPRPVDELPHIAATLRTSEEGQDGLRAFLEKRAVRRPDGSCWGVFADE